MRNLCIKKSHWHQIHSHSDVFYTVRIEPLEKQEKIINKLLPAQLLSAIQICLNNDVN